MSKPCTACRAFVAECQTPIGEGSAPTCWLCAHHIVEHGRALEDAMHGQCECLPEDVYPASVITRQRLAGLTSRGAADVERGRSRLNDLQRRYVKHLPFIKRSTRLLRS